MRKARRFISWEKQVFLVGFSLTFPAFPRISKNRLNTSLEIVGNLQGRGLQRNHFVLLKQQN